MKRFYYHLIPKKEGHPILQGEIKIANTTILLYDNWLGNNNNNTLLIISREKLNSHLEEITKNYKLNEISEKTFKRELKQYLEEAKKGIYALQY